MFHFAEWQLIMVKFNWRIQFTATHCTEISRSVTSDTYLLTSLSHNRTVGNRAGTGFKNQDQVGYLGSSYLLGSGMVCLEQLY